MKIEIERALNCGYRLAVDHHLGWEAFADWKAIQDCNRRAVNAWTRQNTEGRQMGQKTFDRLERVQESAKAKAVELAAKHGWTIREPGLWWQVLDAENHVIGESF